jgi:excisionase family DNA binding protein
MPNYISSGEVARRLEVDRRTVYRWLVEGRLRAIRVGGRWRIDEEDLDRFVLPTVPTKALGDPVAHFDENVRDFVRWAHAINDAAKAAAAATGGRDTRLMDNILDAARAFLRSLDAWQAAGPQEPGGASSTRLF